MTIVRAMKELLEEYEKAKKDVNVRDPVVYALFRTYKKAEKSRTRIEQRIEEE